MIKSKGFTLLELIVAVAIVSILTVMAYGVYSKHMLKSDAAKVQSEMGLIALDLEKYKGKNLSYQGYPTKAINIPKNEDVQPKYSISIVDKDSGKVLSDLESRGASWAIKAESTNPENYTFLITSSGISCKNKNHEQVTYNGCGTIEQGYESW
ncbi:hypothetical protein A7M79_01280 [Acinetobacter baumannii]|uniref:type IV pilin protein n=1 Tax=Acinetobacter baumannii TaxID=470 RepID=UPI0008DC6EDB|nr:prepilin-type N-terminal cleavage/methylation domain-containing protein [Acinetobacter baumannii]OIH12148.1 hypothetical protein A7M79_01280 [Acinetobacter baumannii]